MWNNLRNNLIVQRTVPGPVSILLSFSFSLFLSLSVGSRWFGSQEPERPLGSAVHNALSEAYKSEQQIKREREKEIERERERDRERKREREERSELLTLLAAHPGPTLHMHTLSRLASSLLFHLYLWLATTPSPIEEIKISVSSSQYKRQRRNRNKRNVPLTRSSTPSNYIPNEEERKRER